MQREEFITVMKETPLFSIIMPNYNKGKYIKEAIESVLSQTYSNWELIIVDDASTDNSLDAINAYLNNNKIKLIKNNTNKGVAHVAKQAVESSCGEIIGTVDSDDILLEDALSVMVNEYKANPECGLIYSNHSICDKNSKITGQPIWVETWPDDMYLQEVLLGRQDNATISMHFRTFKRSAYDKTDGYDVSLLCYEDRDLYYKLEKVTKIKGINRCLYYYRDANEMGAFRQNPKYKYYWFICEYKETKRRLRVYLPFANKEKIPLLFSNIMYLHLSKQPTINKGKLRSKLQSFLLGVGYDNLKSNKLLAFLYFINSFIYGYTPITFNRIMKFIAPEHSWKG